MNTASRKSLSLSASERKDSLSRRRPSYQVSISKNTAPPITNGNQPPSSSLSRLEAQNARSTTKKNPVEAMHSASGSFQAYRITKKVSTVVISMSVHTAMP